jgi:nucleotide-binding universal stress UspA family protein
MTGLFSQEHRPVKNILVAIESCETTTIESPLIKKTLEVANAFSSKVWLLHVVPHSHQPPFNIDSQTTRREIASEFRNEHDFLQHLAKCIHKKDIEATALLVQGSVIKTILKESDRLDVDLMMLGCHKHSLLYGALMDNTEEGLLSKCSRPVMFVPESE